MEKILDILKIAIILIAILTGCSLKPQRANISADNPKLIQQGTKTYLLKDNAPLLPLGSKCKVKRTRNPKKANCTIIKH